MLRRISLLSTAILKSASLAAAHNSLFHRSPEAMFVPEWHPKESAPTTRRHHRPEKRPRNDRPRWRKVRGTLRQRVSSRVPSQVSPGKK